MKWALWVGEAKRLADEHGKDKVSSDLLLAALAHSPKRFVADVVAEHLGTVNTKAAVGTLRVAR